MSSVLTRLAALERQFEAPTTPPALSPLELAAAAGITPDDWQRELLESTAPRVLLNCSRQSGKSTVTAVLAVHQALVTPGSLVLLLSRAWRQSSELFKKCMAIYRASGRLVPAEAETALSLTLRNGSRIVSLPGREETIRSFSGVNLLCIDEAARVKNESYIAVRPMLAVSNGRLIALSTPFGTRGWYYESWEHGGADWERYRVDAYQCPRISASFLEEERRTLGEYFYLQEYETAFLDSQESAFRAQDIEGAFAEDFDTWDL